MNRHQTTSLLGLGLWLTLQATPAAAWWQWFYQTNPWAPGLTWGQPWAWGYPAPPMGQNGVQFWQYQSMPFGPINAGPSTMSTAGLHIEQNQSPAGYLIRVRTGQPGTPAVNIDVQGGFLMIQSGSSAGTTGGTGVQMQQFGWASQWISLPADANAAAMRVQWGDGVVEIFFPRLP